MRFTYSHPYQEDERNAENDSGKNRWTQPYTVYMMVFCGSALLNSAAMRVLTLLNVIARYVERMLSAAGA
jgi:hypothetical protein